MDERLQKLKRFNLIMGGFHLIQGLIMAFLATTVIQKIAEFQPTITQFLFDRKADLDWAG